MTARPHPHEWAAAAFVVAGVALLESMPVTYPRSAILGAYASFTGAILALAALVLGAQRLVAWRTGRGRSALALATEAGIVVRAAAVLLVTLAVHFLLKSFIHLLNPATWDRQLLEIDRVLHLGISPGAFLVALLPSPPLLAAIDAFYSFLYYPFTVLSVTLLLTVGPASRRVAFSSAFTLLWIAGAALYLALPSWGPVFVRPDDFEPALQHMPATVHVQSLLYQEILSLVRDPTAPRVIRHGCVAAFPSLHVAVVGLVTLASRARSRRWFRLNLLALAIMVVGSALTGYHYLVDAWAGLALAGLLWVLALRLHPDDPPAAGSEA